MVESRRRRWALVLALGVAVSGIGVRVGVAQDDWAITRPHGDTARPSRGRGARPRVVREREPRRAPEPPSSGDAVVDRYVALLAVRPDDELVARRVAERVGAGFDALVARIEARRTEDPTGTTSSLAALWLARGDDARAAEWLAAAIAGLAPGDRRAASVLRLAARRARRAGDSAGALALAERALAVADGDEREELAREIATAWVEAGRVDEARALYQSIASPRARLEWLTMAVEHEHCEGVEADVEAARAAAHGEASTLVTIALLEARCFERAGQLDAAERALDAAYDLSARAGRSDELLDAEGALARRAGRVEAWIARLERRGDRVAGQRARALEELGRDDEALALYRRHLRVHRRDSEGHERLVRLLLRRGRFDEALEERRVLARSFPERASYTLDLAQALRDAGRVDEGLAVLDGMRARSRRDRAAMYLLVDVLARWGESDRALAVLEALHELDPADPRAATALASEWIERGDRTRAERIIAGVGGGGTIEGELEAARSFANLRQVEDALAHLDAATNLAPDDTRVLSARADLLARFGRDADAERALRRLLELATDESSRLDAEERLVALWVRVRRLDAVRSELGAAFSAGDARSGRLLAEVLRRLGQLDEAWGVLRALASASPDDAPTLRAMQRVAHARDDYDAEVRALRRLVDVEPARAASYYGQLVELAAAQYRDADAIAFAEDATRRSLDDGALALRLGRLHARRRDVGRAAAAYERALTLDPSNEEAAWELASLERERDHAARALELYVGILERARDEELRERVGRALLETSLAGGGLEPIEPTLLGLALQRGESASLRRLALSLYATLASGAHAVGDEVAVARWVERAAPVLLASLRDADLGTRSSARALLSLHPLRGAAPAMLAIACEPGDSAERQRALAAAAPFLVPADVPRLEQLTGDPDVGVAAIAFDALVRVLDGPARARRLGAALQDRRDAIHVYAWFWAHARDAASAGAAPTAARPWSEVVGTRDPSTPFPSVREGAAWPALASDVAWLLPEALEGRVEVAALARHVELAPACLPRLAPIESLERWLDRAARACPSRPRDVDVLRAALEARGVEHPSWWRLVARLAPELDPRGRATLGELARAALATSSAQLAEPELALAVVDVLERAPELLGVDAWRRLAAHTSPSVRGALARALHGAGVVVPPDVVETLLHDAEWNVRRAAVLACVDAPDAWLVGALEDPVAFVRDAAVDVAGERGQPSAAVCGALATLREDPDDVVRQHASAVATGRCVR